MGVISDAIDALEDWCCDLFKDGIKSQFDGISELLTDTFAQTTGSGAKGNLVSNFLTKHPAQLRALPEVHRQATEFGQLSKPSVTML